MANKAPKGALLFLNLKKMQRIS